MSSKRDLSSLSAFEAREEMLAGAFSAEDYVRACLERIAEREPAVEAWAFLDSDFALLQARAADAHRASGRPTGPLHGIPVGLKDIIDTRGMPTENGTPIDAGRRPAEDATLVAKLREAGAIIMGKTVTTELAVFTPGKTRNPHDPKRTPGGSSSGSAAAVAANMVPLAVGTQTNGSVIRPASFCGVVGFKPSRGAISRRGVLVQSPFLDTVGTFARTVEDAALLAEAISGHDPADPCSERQPRPDLLALATRRPPVTPALALVRSPMWDRAEGDVRHGFAELSAALGPAIQDVELPDIFASGHEWHRTIMLAEIASTIGRYAERNPEAVSQTVREMIEEGSRIRAVDYLRAIEGIARLNIALELLFDRFDALVTPAARGEAPVGLESTGDPVFSTLWSACGVPAVTLPLLTGSNNLPIGVQLVARRFHDGRLLRTARWLEGVITGSGQALSRTGQAG